MKTKKCGKCKVSKKLKLFGKNKNRCDGVQGYCKECIRQYHQDNKESTFRQHLYPKGQKPYRSSYRTHQAELRSILIDERGTTCEKCSKDAPKGIICHHIHPVKTDPLESLDKDNCILVCYECDYILHQKDGCKTGQLAHMSIGERC